MSSFIRKTRHPITGNVEDAFWIDDCFGEHKYGIQFKDGKTFTKEEIDESENSS